jgi:hypothetical protein
MQMVSAACSLVPHTGLCCEQSQADPTREELKMTRSPRSAALALLAATGLVLSVPGSAWGHPDHQDGSASDVARDTHQHGDSAGHLPATKSNVDLVSKLQLKNVVPEKIADVGVYKNYAYLAAWGAVTCKYNGVHVVDIADPAAPKEVAFIVAKEGSYPGEGIQALSVDTPSFTGDILVSNNEKCLDKTKPGFGGLNIYNVSDPRHPVPLAEGIGDFGVTGQGKKDAHEIHSVFAWDAGDRAYAAIVDNEEAQDLDIMDITDPKKPFLTAEYELAEIFPITQATPTNLTEVFLHDLVVRKVGNRFLMSASNWDAGYVVLDVTDPKGISYIADSDYAQTDPALAGTPYAGEAPEGNGHQSEWTRDNKYLIATDEDFSPYRSGPFSVAGLPYDAVAVGGGGSPADLPDKRLNGPVVYGGYGCPTSAAVPPASTALAGVTLASGEEKIVVLQRGPSDDPSAPEEACFPGDKAASAAAAGYDAVVLVNRHFGSAAADEAYCGSGGYPPGLSFPTVCTTHAAFHDMFNKDANYAVPYVPGTEPAIGAVGDAVDVSAFFNGWGYVHLFKNGAGKLQDLDQYVIPEAINPDFAKGFGDLSVHEVATSHVRDDLAYLSYYAGGLRVVRVTADEKLQEVGRFIDEGGNNFWGVDVFQRGGVEYVAASDRDHGLYIFRYTGG